jgi:hypothetical protein
MALQNLDLDPRNYLKRSATHNRSKYRAEILHMVSLDTNMCLVTISIDYDLSPLRNWRKLVKFFNGLYH